MAWNTLVNPKKTPAMKPIIAKRMLKLSLNIRKKQNNIPYVIPANASLLNVNSTGSASIFDTVYWFSKTSAEYERMPTIVTPIGINTLI